MLSPQLPRGMHFDCETVGRQVLEAIESCQSGVEFPDDLQARFEKLLEVLGCKGNSFDRAVSMVEALKDANEIRLTRWYNNNGTFVPGDSFVQLAVSDVGEIGRLAIELLA